MLTASRGRLLAVHRHLAGPACTPRAPVCSMLQQPEPDCGWPGGGGQAAGDQSEAVRAVRLQLGGQGCCRGVSAEPDLPGSGQVNRPWGQNGLDIGSHTLIPVHLHAYCSTAPALGCPPQDHTATIHSKCCSQMAVHNVHVWLQTFRFGGCQSLTAHSPSSYASPVAAVCEPPSWATSP